MTSHKFMSSNLNTAFILSDEFIKHLTGPSHPECPERVSVIKDILNEKGLINRKNTFSPRMATVKDLLRCHTKGYIDLVKSECSKLASKQLAMLSTGDVVICHDSYDIGCLSAGASLVAADLVMTNQVKRVFCNIRPPGHHACKSQGMGFCLFNNIAICCRYAQEKYNIKRVLIVDWDVHHGNGTQDIFYDDPNVFYLSTHQYGIYPGTGHPDEIGKGSSEPHILNFPIHINQHPRETIFHVFNESLKKTMKSFKPELVLISSGFDAHIHDPIGGLDLTSEDFASLTRFVTNIANEHCDGKIISLLEGGYNLIELPKCALEHIQELNKN